LNEGINLVSADFGMVVLAYRAGIEKAERHLPFVSLSDKIGSHRPGDFCECLLNLRQRDTCIRIGRAGVVALAIFPRIPLVVRFGKR
jgi:hypothetical protein